MSGLNGGDAPDDARYVECPQTCAWTDKRTLVGLRLGDPLAVLLTSASLGGVGGARSATQQGGMVRI